MNRSILYTLIHLTFEIRFERQEHSFVDRMTSERIEYLWHVVLSNIPLIIVRRAAATSNLYAVRSGLITFNLEFLQEICIPKHFYQTGNLLSKFLRYELESFPCRLSLKQLPHCFSSAAIGRLLFHWRAWRGDRKKVGKTEREADTAEVAWLAIARGIKRCQDSEFKMNLI